MFHRRRSLGPPLWSTRGASTPDRDVAEGPAPPSWSNGHGGGHASRPGSPEAAARPYTSNIHRGCRRVSQAEATAS